MRDYIPRKDGDLVAWSANFASEVVGHIAAWGIPEQDAVDLQTATTNFALIYRKANSAARTSGLVTAKDTARKILVKMIRGLVNFQLKNPIITDAERVDMKIPVYDKVRTSRFNIVTRPKITIGILDVRRLKVNFSDINSASKAKPHGIIGALVYYSVLDTPATSIADLKHSVLATRTPYRMEFDEKLRGKTVYIALCWQNGRGKTGPFSDIKSAIIP